jgi:hypothetical protein
MSVLKNIGNLLLGWLIPDVPRAETGIDVSQASTDAYIPVHYGRGYGTGTIIYQATNDADNDDIKNDLLHQVIVWGEGACGGVTLNYVDDDLDTSTRFDAPNSKKWFNAINFNNGIGIYADPLLVASGWRTNDTCERKMCTYARSEMGGDDVWSGEPRHKAEWAGRLISSPSGGAATASENPIDQLYDYLKNDIYGKGLSTDRIDVTAFQSQRSIPATLVETYPGSGVNRKLFTSNVSLDTGNSVLDNVNTLCRSMRCLLTISNGKLKPIIEIDQAAVDFPITDEDSGLIEFGKITNSSKSNRFNRVTTTYTDPDSGWTKQEAIYPPVGSALETQYLAEDNGVVLEKNNTLETCIYYNEALHNAKTLLEISREQLRTTILYGAEASILEVGDIIPVTRLAAGWSAKLFRIESTSEDLQTGDVELVVREHQPYIYDDNNTGDKPSIPDTTLTYTKPAAPTNGAHSSVYDNFTQVQLSWDSTTLDHSITISDSGDTPLITEYINRKTYQISSLPIGTYTVNIKAIGGLGRKSDVYTFTFDIAQTVTPTGAPDINITPGNIVVTPPTPISISTLYEGLNTTNLNLNPNSDALTLFAVIPAGLSLSIPQTTNGQTYYIWYRLKAVEGYGAWVSASALAVGIIIPVWLFGEGVPASGLGVDGDNYLDNATNNIYTKGGGTWTLTGNLGSGDGDKWFSDAGAPLSSIGVDGDWYINLTNYDIYLRSTAWILQGNIKGPVGPGVAVVDNGNGTYTITGSNGAVIVSDGNSPNAIIPTVTDNGNGTYTVEDGGGGSVIISDGETPVKGVDYFDGIDGSFVSFVYRNGASKPYPTPTGGFFDGATEAFPADTTDVPNYVEGQITWVSKTRYTKSGATWDNNGWSDYSEYVVKGGVGDSIEIIYSANRTDSYHVPPFVDGDLWMKQRVGSASFSEPMRIIGEKGDDAIPTIVAYSVDGLTNWHSVFASGDLYMQIQTNGVWGSASRIVGEQGGTGNFIDYRFQNGPTSPGYTNVSAPSGWLDGPSTPSSGQFTWVIKGLKTAGGTLIGTWEPPSRLSGEKGGSGDSIEIIYSANRTDSYHLPPFVDGDLWMQQRVGSASFSEPMRIIGEKGDDAIPTIVAYSVDGLTNWHSVFASGDLYMQIQTNGVWGSASRIVGEQGGTGNFIDYRFQNGPTSPGYTNVSAPSGWLDGPSTPSSGQFTWVIKGLKTAGGTLIGTWEPPSRLSGEKGGSGDSIEIIYSANEFNSYHVAPFVDGDLWMKQRVGSASFSEPIRIVGEQGNGGNYVDIRFDNGTNAPSLTNTTALPTGWTDGPTSPVPDGEFTWMIKANKTAAGALIGVWSAPVKITGDTGAALEVIYSANRTDSYHVAPFVDGDLWMKQRVGSASFSEPIRIVGEQGNGGNYVDIRFDNGTNAPSLTNTTALPTGWTDGPTSPVPDGEFTWMIKANKTAAGALIGVWSAPVKITGDTLPAIEPELPIEKYSWTVYSDSKSSGNIYTSNAGSRTYTGVVHNQLTGANPNTAPHSTYNWYLSLDIIDLTNNTYLFGELDAENINVGDLFAKEISATGHILYNNGSNEARLGGGNLFEARNSGGEVLRVTKSGAFTFSGDGVKDGSIPEGALSSAEIQRVLAAGGTPLPDTGGVASTNFSVSGNSTSPTITIPEHGTNSVALRFTATMSAFVYSNPGTVSFVVQFRRAVGGGGFSTISTQTVTADVIVEAEVGAWSVDITGTDGIKAYTDTGATTGQPVSYQVTISSADSLLASNIASCSLSATEAATGGDGGGSVSASAAYTWTGIHTHDADIIANTKVKFGASGAIYLGVVGTQIRAQTAAGYCAIGPTDSNYNQFSTDVTKHWFNKPIEAVTSISIFGFGSTKLDAAGVWDNGYRAVTSNQGVAYNSALLGGAAKDSGGGGNTIAQRTGDGGLVANTFWSGLATNNTSIAHVMTKQGWSNALRPTSVSSFRSVVTDSYYLGINSKASDSSKLNGKTETSSNVGNSIVSRSVAGDVALNKLYYVTLQQSSTLVSKNVLGRMTDTLESVCAIGAKGALVYSPKSHPESVKYGFALEETDPYFPNASGRDKYGRLEGMEYTQMISPAYTAINQLNQKIEVQQTTINSLITRLEALENPA